MTELPVVDIVMNDGRVFERVAVDGGGTEMTGPNAGRREVHGTYSRPTGNEDTFFCQFEDEIESVCDSETRETVQIGVSI